MIGMRAKRVERKKRQRKGVRKEIAQISEGKKNILEEGRMTEEKGEKKEKTEQRMKLIKRREKELGGKTKQGD